MMNAPGVGASIYGCDRIAKSLVLSGQSGDLPVSYRKYNPPKLFSSGFLSHLGAKICVFVFLSEYTTDMMAVMTETIPECFNPRRLPNPPTNFKSPIPKTLNPKLVARRGRDPTQRQGQGQHQGRL